MLTEFNVGETCTAVITSHMEATGENFDGAISIGYYDGSDEIWIGRQGQRLSIQAHDVDTLCKQLKRAKTLAAAAKEPGS
jgi:hypothetical protein